MHIEDQVFPKRCGHLDGKTLISTDDMVEKVRAASDSRLSDDDFILIARTDARSVSGIEDAIERANAYRRRRRRHDLPRGPHAKTSSPGSPPASPGLLLANMTEFGKTPDIPAPRFGELGYDLVIYPLSMMRLAMGHVVRGLIELRQQGTVAGLLDQMQTRAELYDLLGYEPGAKWTFPSSESNSG
jgi:methylisocitrate lyase